MWKTDRYRELTRLVRGGWLRDEVDEELQHHIAMRISDNRAGGMSEEDARADALRRFGNIDRISRETLHIEQSAIREERRMEIFGTIRRELLQAVRTVMRKPSFAIVSVLTLALGLAGTTAIFAVIDSVILNPLSYTGSDELVYVSSGVPKTGPDAEWAVSVAGYFHFVGHQHTMQDLGAYMTSTVNVASDGPAERVSAAVVTRSLLQTLRVRTTLGRVFDAAEDAPRSDARVVLLGHAFWRTHFGGDASIVGSTIRIGGEPYRVIGVTTEDAQLPGEPVDLWLPFGLDPSAPPVNSHYLRVVGRLARNMSVSDATSDLSRLTNDFVRLFPSAYSKSFMEETGFHTQVVPLRDRVVGDIGHMLWMLFAAVSFVLVIACANVANLFLVQTEHRQREVAMRNALGASRIHLAFHYLTESALLCAAAGLVAVFAARSGLRLLVSLAPAGLPRLNEVRLGGHAIAFTFVAAALAAVVFGAFPLLRAGRGSEALRDASRGNSPSRARRTVRSALIIAQVALSVVLLAGAGLMIRSVRALRAVNPGVQPDGVVTLEVSVPENAFQSQDARVSFFRQLTDEIGAMSGVQRVAVTNYVPLRGADGCASIYVDASVPGKQPPCEFVATAGPGTFEALGMHVRGRTPGWNDITSNSGAVVVTEAFARRFWPNQDPIGRGVTSGGDRSSYYRVVGVVENARGARVDEPELVGVFYPLRTIPGGDLWGGAGATTLVVRTASGDPLSLVPSIREALRRMSPDASIANVRTLDDIVRRSMQRTSFIMMLLTIAATMSLALSAVGLYGVMSHVVDQRRSEIGLRIALGASASEVRGLVLRESLTVVSAGLLIGLLAAVTTSGVLRSMLFGVGATDAVTLGAVSALLLCVAVAATWVPSSRAARTQPIGLMR